MSWRVTPFPAKHGKTFIQHIHQFITIPEALGQDHALPEARIRKKAYIMRQHAKIGDKTSPAAVNQRYFLLSCREFRAA